MPSSVDLVAYQHAQGDGLAALLRYISEASIVLTHSQGAPAGWLAADACPHLVKAIIAVEPNGPPFAGAHPHNDAPARLWGLTDVPMTFWPSIETPSQFRLKTTDTGIEGKSLVVLQNEGDSESPVHQLVRLKDIPVLVEVGEASYHAGFDHATVAFLRQAGVRCEFIELENQGIRGNGHMQMLELNNLEIAAVLHKWIADNNLAITKR